MVSSQKPTHGVQRGQGPDTLPALREMLIQDPRIGRVEVHPDGNGSSDRHDRTAPKEIHHAPSIAPTVPSSELNSQRASLQSDGTSNDRPSVGRRVFHTVARGFIVIAMVCAAFALLSDGGDKKKDIVRAWDHSLNWLSSVLGTNSSQDSDVAPESGSKPLDQTPTQNTALLPAAPHIQPAPASVATASSPELQHQLETMVSDLADVRRLVEQLAARQDQMVRDIATLQAAEQNVSQKLSSLPESQTVRVPRKKAVRPVHKSTLSAYPNRPRTDGLPVE